MRVDTIIDGLSAKENKGVQGRIDEGGKIGGAGGAPVEDLECCRAYPERGGRAARVRRGFVVVGENSSK